jgi:nucleoside-diphosphate-sugar epimerase
MYKKKILATGGVGFIGAHTSEVYDDPSVYPLPSDDPKQRKPNIELAKEKLGWEPAIKLKEGLVKTIDYFEKII